MNYGIKNLNTITLRKEVSGWDKALFFFIYINRNYENIWFIEDDIFIYDENTLRNIDEKNPDADIICNSSFEEAKLDEWLWGMDTSGISAAVLLWYDVCVPDGNENVGCIERLFYKT